MVKPQIHFLKNNEMKNPLKRISIVFAVFMSLFILTGCSVSKPESTAKKYFKALEDRELDEAKFHVEIYSLDLFNELIGDGSGLASKYTVLRVEQVSETEAIAYYSEDDKDEEMMLTLVKVNDNWKVKLDMDDK